MRNVGGKRMGAGVGELPIPRTGVDVTRWRLLEGRGGREDGREDGWEEGREEGSGLGVAFSEACRTGVAGGGGVREGGA